MYYLAIDIGASSGRHIVGWMEKGAIQQKEVYRFPNGVYNHNGHLTWDVDALLQEVKNGIKAAFKEFGTIASLSIDTWGVDYVLLQGDEEIRPVYAYRDSRTEAVIPKVHEILPFDTLYSHTGCQFQPFNTVYQLYDDLCNGRLDKATDMLMMPEYLLYKLTGVKAREYTNATTMGMINAKTGEFDSYIVDKLGYPVALFPRLSKPGTKLGMLKKEIAEEVGGNCMAVLCATHDTGSAVEGIFMEEDAPYISSGTWSLLGVKTPKPITDDNSRKANYSNEGGVGYNRYQKNIMGMWLVNCLQKELCPELTFSQIVELAQNSSCDVMVDANAPEFLAPESMKAAFDRATGNALKTVGDYFCCAYRSLAISYRDALNELEHNTGRKYDRLYIVGGGAKNVFLNRLTKEATGKKVIALPIEATALGNLMVQIKAEETMHTQELSSLAAMSNQYGSDPAYVLAGGGNTSFKSADRLWIKGSGTSLATIMPEDFVVLDRSALAKMWDTVYPEEEKAREAAVLADMMTARVPGEQRRPSVETLLHDLFPQRYILHVHPAIVNGLTCSMDGKAAMKRLFPDAVWVDACKPGYILALECKKKMDAYQAETGKACDLLFLQNHGIFFAGETTEAVDVLAKQVMDTLAGAVNRQPNLCEIACDTTRVQQISGMLKAMYGEEASVVFMANAEILAYDPATKSLSPDHIVYAKAKQLALNADIDDDGIRSAFAAFKAKNGYAPKIVFVQGLGMFACGTGEKEVSTALAVMMDAIKVCAYAQSFGGVSAMPEFLIDFIVNWEVESYRSKVSLNK